MTTEAVVGSTGNASGGALVLYGVLFVLIGGIGVGCSIQGRPFPRRLARLGNGIAAGGICLAGIAMIIVGLIQLL